MVHYILQFIHRKANFFPPNKCWLKCFFGWGQRLVGKADSDLMKSSVSTARPQSCVHRRPRPSGSAEPAPPPPQRTQTSPETAGPRWPRRRPRVSVVRQVPAGRALPADGGVLMRSLSSRPQTRRPRGSSSCSAPRTTTRSTSPTTCSPSWTSWPSGTGRFRCGRKRPGEDYAACCDPSLWFGSTVGSGPVLRCEMTWVSSRTLDQVQPGASSFSSFQSVLT